MKKNLILLFLFTFITIYPQQSFRYRELSADLKAKVAVNPSEITKIQKSCFSKAKDLTEFLPKNYDKTGKTDYTAALQKGINSSNDVMMPDFPVLVNHVGLQLKSDTKVLFRKNSKLIVKPNDKEFYAALNLENVKNVKVYFANLEGERFQHQSTKGEWGMGIYIVHSEDLYFYKPTIKKFWGDGLYIGKLEGKTSKNIEIDGAFIDENRRNGISIIAGENVKISNSVIANTYGTIPEYGIDLEPNKPQDELTNINIENTVTYNNSKGGVLFALDNLQGLPSKPVTVKIKNHTDYYSEKGVEFYADRGYQKFVQPLKGKITFDGLSLLHNKTPLINNQSQRTGIELILSNISANNIKVNSNKLNNFAEKLKTGKEEIIR